MTPTLALLAVLLAVQQPTRLHIVVIEGEGAVNIIQQKTAVAPVIEVRDQNNVPVAGAVVKFTIAGGKQAAFAGGSQTLTVTTNAAGRAAAAAVNPLSSGTVQIQVEAAFQGQTGAATIAQSNVMTAGQAATASASGGGGGGGIGAGTIAGIAGGVVAGGAALVLKEKMGSGVDETSVAIDPAVQAASGTYALQTVNGAGLPATTVASPPASCPVVTDNATLTLTAQGLEYEVIENSRTECRIGPSTTFRSSNTGTWTLSGSAITFTARNNNFILDAGTLSGSTVTTTVQPPHLDGGQQAPRVTTVWRK